MNILTLMIYDTGVLKMKIRWTNNLLSVGIRFEGNANPNDFRIRLRNFKLFVGLSPQSFQCKEFTFPSVPCQGLTLGFQRYIYHWHRDIGFLEYDESYEIFWDLYMKR